MSILLLWFNLSFLIALCASCSSLDIIWLGVWRRDACGAAAVDRFFCSTTYLLVNLPMSCGCPNFVIYRMRSWKFVSYRLLLSSCLVLLKLLVLSPIVFEAV